MADAFDLPMLTALVQWQLPSSATLLRLTPLRTGKHNASFWVESDEGRYVLHIAPPDDAGFLFYGRRMMRQEPALHALIRARTTIPIARWSPPTSAAPRSTATICC